MVLAACSSFSASDTPAAASAEAGAADGGGLGSSSGAGGNGDGGASAACATPVTASLTFDDDATGVGFFEDSSGSGAIAWRSDEGHANLGALAATVTTTDWSEAQLARNFPVVPRSAALSFWMKVAPVAQDQDPKVGCTLQLNEKVGWSSFSVDVAHDAVEFDQDGDVVDPASFAVTTYVDRWFSVSIALTDITDTTAKLSASIDEVPVPLTEVVLSGAPTMVRVKCGIDGGRGPNISVLVDDVDVSICPR